MKRTDGYLNNDYGIHLRGGASIMTGIGLPIFAIFIVPWLTFWLAYFGGWIAKIVIGDYLVKGFALLGLTVPIDKIPLIAGLMGWIGSCLNRVRNSNKSDN